MANPWSRSKPRPTTTPTQSSSAFASPTISNPKAPSISSSPINSIPPPSLINSPASDCSSKPSKSPSAAYNIERMLTLTNQRILITRTRHQASELATQLEALGAITILIPTIEIAPPETFAPLDAALTCLRTYDWLIFTSANAVEAFHRRAQFQRLTQLRGHIAVIGPATLRAA